MKELRKILKSRRGGVEYTYRLMLIGIAALLLTGVALSYIGLVSERATRSANITSDMVELRAADSTISDILSLSGCYEGSTSKDKDKCKRYCLEAFTGKYKDSPSASDCTGEKASLCKLCMKECDVKC